MKRNIFIILYLVLSVLIFGCFMGVTIGNLLFNIILALFVFKKDIINLTQYRTLTFITLLGANISSAYIALTDNYTAANLEGMLHLNFEVTTSMIWGLIVIGGLLLILINDLIITYIYVKQAK